MSRVDPHIHNQLIFNKGTMSINEKVVFSISIQKKIDFNLHLTVYTEFNSKSIIDLKIQIK